MDILERFYKRDIRALSKIISIIEDQENEYQDLLGKLYLGAGRSLRIGVTGAPGVGKSTLVNGLTHEFLRAGKRVGIIAVDPTSPFTGGALLGDRIRMSEFPSEGRVYFRSMATRGATGGLASATGNVAVAYDAFGFEVTLIETVGVGQIELDIVDACDTVIVVVVPESGDAVQAMKAGLLEIADILCVNKADRPGVERVVFDLEQALSNRKKREGVWTVPVIATEAINGKNVDLLHAKIEQQVEFIRVQGHYSMHRRIQIKKKLMSLLENRVNELIRRKLAQIADLDKIVSDICDGKTDPYTVSRELLKLLDFHVSDD
jgi:LAO/AO transport system kinase